MAKSAQTNTNSHWWRLIMKLFPMRELPPNMTLKQAMYLLQDGRCPYCGRVMVFTYKDIARLPRHIRKRAATDEHLTPRSRQGDNSHSNRMLVCFECNGRRDSGPAYVGMYVMA